MTQGFKCDHILKQPGRVRQRRRYKTIDLIIMTEYNSFMWECNLLTTFPSSSLETEHENISLGVSQRTWAAYHSLCAFKTDRPDRTSKSWHPNTFMQNRKIRKSYTNKKMANGKLKFQKPSSLIFMSKLLKLPNVPVCGREELVLWLKWAILVSSSRFLFIKPLCKQRHVYRTRTIVHLWLCHWI